VLLHTWGVLVLQFKTTFSTWWKFSSFVLLDNWKILVFEVKTTHTSSTPWNFSSFVLLRNRGILVLGFKTTILLQLHEIFLPLCATSQLKDFGSLIQNNSYFFNSMTFCFLCATSQLRDFGSWIQNNSYFFNSMKFFFLCALLHNWRILVLGFKTTHTSSTPWNFFFLCVLLHNWRILVLGFKTTHTSSTPSNFSSFVRYFTIEGFWFLDSKQLILLQNSMKFFFLCALLHNWRILVLRFKTTHTSSNWIS
jgi:hypothetical protein